MRGAVIFLLAGAAAAAQPASEEAARRAAEVLSARCGVCHGKDAPMSDLRLTGREQILRGGKRGAAVVPGNAAASRLYQAVTHAVEPAMPPGNQLSAEEIAILKTWIEAGAPWPASAGALKASSWWSFRKPVRPAAPESGAGWARTAIDRFVYAGMQAKNLKPAPEAGRFTLLRRATFDLLGLPPAPEEVESFLSDSSPDAYEKLIDRLLASPHYGEKWGRHWLDLVRYADTSGFEQDPYILEAWRYRDWVIRSFNQDKPYDRFLKEQIAGDELWPEDPEARSGTGYFCVGANRDMLFKVEDINRVETLTDYVDTTASVFLGLTAGCARCHDHKFDPIPQRDYYRMQAIFAPAVKTRVFLDYNPARFYDLAANSREFKLRQIGAEISRIEAPYRKQIYKQKVAGLPEKTREAFLTDESKRTPEQQELVEAQRKYVSVSDDEIRGVMSQADTERLHAIEKKLAAIFAGHEPPPMAPGIMDIGREAPRTYIAMRGDPKSPGERVEPGFLTALGGGDIPEPPEHSETTFRRRALAEWIARPDHPLTARVMVNRVWQHHFGRGLVATPSDFGARGEQPSHPELLDWLATEVAGQGWSIKKLHKLIMTSAVYRQCAGASQTAAAQDPQNILLSHFNRRRLQSEEIRDAVLSVAGTLNPKMGGVPVVPPLDEEELYGIIGKPADAWAVTPDPGEHTRRSVYLLTRRTFKAPMFEVFDTPDGILPCPRRDSSTIAPQSLTLLNGTFTLQQAKALAAKLAESPENARIVEAWQRVLGREPKPAEKTAAAAFLARQTKNLGSEQAALAELARSLFNLNEFLYVD